MQPTSLKSHLLILGAQTRLKELNKERNELLKILGIKEDVSAKEYGIIKELNKIRSAPLLKKQGKHRTYKGKHWTQRPENRAKMLRQIRKATKARFK